MVGVFTDRSETEVVETEVLFVTRVEQRDSC